MNKFALTVTDAGLTIERAWLSHRRIQVKTMIREYVTRSARRSIIWD